MHISHFIFLLMTYYLLFILYLFCATCAKSLQSRPTLCHLMDCHLPGSSIHGIFPSKNTRVGCHVLLQGIFPTQGSNSCLLFSCTGRFFTINTTREALEPSHNDLKFIIRNCNYFCINLIYTTYCI